MSTPLHPLGDYVVAQAEAAETKTASGLYLPNGAQEKTVVVKVLSVGSDVQHIKVGDRIVHKEYSATKLKIGKDEFILVKEEDILATVK